MDAASIQSMVVEKQLVFLLGLRLKIGKVIKANYRSPTLLSGPLHLRARMRTLRQLKSSE